MLDGGSVVFDAPNLSKLRADALADVRWTKMGFVFQQPTLLKNLNVLDHIMLPSVRDGRKSAAQIGEKDRALLKMTGIAELETRGVSQASGRKLHRVGICRALMGDPGWPRRGTEPLAVYPRTDSVILDGPGVACALRMAAPVLLFAAGFVALAALRFRVAEFKPAHGPDHRIGSAANRDGVLTKHGYTRPS